MTVLSSDSLLAVRTYRIDEIFTIHRSHLREASFLQWIEVQVLSRTWKRLQWYSLPTVLTLNVCSAPHTSPHSPHSLHSPHSSSHTSPEEGTFPAPPEHVPESNTNWVRVPVCTITPRKAGEGLCSGFVRSFSAWPVTMVRGSDHCPTARCSIHTWIQ
jgi:hypothetical protein